MPRFNYKAVTAAGELLEGEIDAPARAAVIERLRSQGHLPIRADQISVRAGASMAPRNRLLRPRRLSPGTVVLLTRELATLLRAGLPLDRSLTILRDIVEDGRKREFVQRLLEAVRGGVALADALEMSKNSLPPYYIGLVRAGEAGGTLEPVLARLADVLERALSLRESVRSAMYYPMFVLAMSVITLLMLLTVVVPEFRPIFDDASAPMPTSMAVIIAIGDGLKDYWWGILLLVSVVILAARRYVSQPRGRWQRDRWLLHVPLIGDIILKVEVARFARTLGTLLTNGVTVLNAVSITAGTVANQVVAQAIGGLAIRLKRGEGLAIPLMETGVFPRLAVQLVRVGEESGQLEAMLLNIADIYEEEVKRGLQRALSLLVPVVTICLGFLVAAIISSMLIAILSTYDLPF